MSLMNWTVVDEQRAIVACDTLSFDAHGNRLDQSKIHALPSACMVVGGRGNLAFCNTVHQRAWWSGLSFDGVVGNTPEWLRQALAGAPEHVEHDHEVLLCGWSEMRRRMWAVQFVHHAGRLISRAQAWGCSPGEPLPSGLQPPKDDAAMIYVARQQAAWAGRETERRTGEMLAATLSKATTPPAAGPSTEAPSSTGSAWQAGCTPIGGRLLIAEVTRQSISMRTVAVLD